MVEFRALRPVSGRVVSFLGEICTALIFLLGISTAPAQTTATLFSQEAPRCQAWFPVQLSDASAVVSGRIWWRGRTDASLALGFGFTEEALLLDGEFLDNVPFQQGFDLPHRPANWGLTYVADGLEFLFEDVTSSSRRIRFVLNTGSGAVRPRIDLLDTDTTTASRAGLQPNPAPAGTVPRAPIARVCPGADISLFDGIVPEDSDEPTTRFQIAIPRDQISDEPMSNRSWRVTIRMHDLDIEMMRFKILEDVVVTPPPPEPAG